MIYTRLGGRGGGVRQILSLALELQKAGHKVEIFTNAVSERCYPELLKKVVVNVVPNPLIPFRQNSESFISRSAASKEVNVASNLREWIRRTVGRQYYTTELPSMLSLGRNIAEGFDIINNHNFPTEWAAFLAKKRLKAPVVWMCNEPPFWFLASEYKKGLRKINWPLFEVLDRTAVDYIDEIIVLSSIAAGYVRKAYNRAAKVVRTGVDIDLFRNASKEEVRRKYGLENDFILLQVGNIAPDKRQGDSIMALYYLSKNYDNVKLILDGGEGGGSRGELIRLSEKLGIKDKVLFWHSCSDEEIAEVYAACDVFVFPAHITWGLAVIEAMAASKPVIVSKMCGASEIIQSGVNGIVIDNTNPEEWARQIELLMNNPKLRKKLGENAYGYVSKNLSWEKYARNMARVFQQAITSSRRNS